MCIVIILSVQVKAMAEQSNMYGSFANIPASARQFVFGNSFVAIDDDINAIYSNPASVANIYQTGITLSHTNLYGIETMNYDSAGIVYSNLPFFLPKGLIYRRFGISSLITADVYGNITSFDSSYAENTVGLNFPYKLPYNFSVGITPKIFLLQATDENANGFGLDIGIINSKIFEIEKVKFFAGCTAYNILSSLKYTGSNYTEKFPIQVDVGSGVKWRDASILFGYTQNIKSISIVGEYTIAEIFSIRAGLGNTFGENTYRAGFGLNTGGILSDDKLGVLVIDYGYEHHLSLGATHRFSMVYNYDLRGIISIPDAPRGGKVVINGKPEIDNIQDSNLKIRVMPEKYKVEVYDEAGDIDRIGPSYQERYIPAMKEVKMKLDKSQICFKDGMKYLKRCEYENAKTEFIRATNLNNNYPEAWYQLGRTYEFLREHNMAIEAYKKALEVEPLEYQFLEGVIKYFESNRNN